MKLELVVLLHGARAGRLVRDGDRVSFAYDDAWRERDDAVPISLSMPLLAERHDRRTIEAYLWGLLPDSHEVLRAWGREFHVSAGNPFALIAHVGEDCAGAVQFAAPERVPFLLDERPPQIAWQSEEEVGAHLRLLREDLAAWRVGGGGQFSLAGAQRKTARYFEDGRWGVPSGRTPTTHILKPPIPGLAGHVENEHFCLRLADEIGLPAATSEVRRLAGEEAIVLTRYDRVRALDLAALEESRGTAESLARAAAFRERAPTQPVLRVHQEDLCQALGVHPDAKYQSDGGPTPKDVVDLLREHSADPVLDVARFVDALIFNWLILGPDAHAKNYSLLHQQAGRPRLAPLYDVASVLPYPEQGGRTGRRTLAMKVGSEYLVRNIRRRHWVDTAERLRLNPERTISRAEELAEAVRRAAPLVRDELVADGLTHAVVPHLADLLVERAEACLRILAAA